MTAVLVGLVAGSAKADPIVWQTPQKISGDSDVSTSGHLVYAENFGDQTVAAQTINGVTFAAFDASDANNLSGTATHGNVTVSGIDPNFNGAGAYTSSAAAPFTSLSPSYQQLLTQVVFAKAPGEGGGPVDLVLTMNGLTSGDSYQFEAWSNDSRGNQGGSSSTRSETITDGTNTSSPLFFNTVQATEGGLGSYIIGTFRASGSSETLTFVGDPMQGDAQINAIELRDVTVPEPRTLASLVGLGAIGLLAIAIRPWRKALVPCRKV
jgi:hypothetical protein